MQGKIQSLGLLVVLFAIFLVQGTVCAEQSDDSCGGTLCGSGYKAEQQLNGSCMCVLDDCSSLGGCPPLPKTIEDCASIEGCPPPPATTGP